MKKSVFLLAAMLVLVSIFTISCSSDKKTEDKKSSGSTSDKTSNKAASGSRQDKAAEAKFDEDVAAMKANVAAACAQINTHYTNFKTPGNEADGFDEIIDIQSQFTTLGGEGLYGEYGSANYITFDDWPDYGKYATYFDDVIQPYWDKMDYFYESLNAVTDAAIYDSQTAEQVQQIHTTMSEFETYMSTQEFGPCNID